MKWSNKGQEFDKVYDEISKKDQYYLFGAGDYGKQFIEIIKDEIEICAFIDNKIENQGKKINNYQCISFSEAFPNIKQNTGIIVTISQYLRMTAMNQLEKFGLKKNKDFFMIEDFLSVYFMYKYNKVYMSSISFLPSTVCNLNCAQCLNFNPFSSKSYIREWSKIIADIDLFFSKVDRVMLFHLSGGEPMMYPKIAELIEHIDKNYGSQIDNFRTVTNGTIIPSQEILDILASSHIRLTVDDYRDAVPQYKEQFDLLITKLKQNKIHYIINKVDSWVDLAPEKTDFSHYSEKKLQEHFDTCCQTWQELREGKLYLCNYASYAAVAGLTGSIGSEETYNLEESTNNKELIEFRLGYSTKGYTDFCKRCRGFILENVDKVIPAKQVIMNK